MAGAQSKLRGSPGRGCAAAAIRRGPGTSRARPAVSAPRRLQTRPAWRPRGGGRASACRRLGADGRVGGGAHLVVSGAPRAPAGGRAAAWAAPPARAGGRSGCSCALPPNGPAPGPRARKKNARHACTVRACAPGRRWGRTCCCVFKVRGPPKGRPHHTLKRHLRPYRVSDRRQQPQADAGEAAHRGARRTATRCGPCRGQRGRTPEPRGAGCAARGCCGRSCFVRAASWAGTGAANSQELCSITRYCCLVCEGWSDHDLKIISLLLQYICWLITIKAYMPARRILQGADWMRWTLHTETVTWAAQQNVTQRNPARAAAGCQRITLAFHILLRAQRRLVDDRTASQALCAARPVTGLHCQRLKHSPNRTQQRRSTTWQGAEVVVPVTVHTMRRSPGRPPNPHVQGGSPSKSRKQAVWLGARGAGCAHGHSPQPKR